MFKVRSRDVNTYLKRAVVGKQMQFFRRFANDIAGKGNNQVLRFRNRDKHVRLYPAHSGIVPAEQDLNADAALHTGVHLRLTVEAELFTGDAHVDLA